MFLKKRRYALKIDVGMCALFSSLSLLQIVEGYPDFPDYP